MKERKLEEHEIKLVLKNICGQIISAHSFLSITSQCVCMFLKINVDDNVPKKLNKIQYYYNTILFIIK